MTDRGATLFARRGYVVLKGLLDPGTAGAVRREVERALSTPYDPSCVRPNNTLVPLRWRDPIVELVLSSEERLNRLRKAVSARDLRWISGYVSTKDAESEALAWHQDWWCWDHPASFKAAAPQVALLCYLTPTDRSTGALRVLPGSHRRSTPLHAALPEAHGHAEKPTREHASMQDHPMQVTITAAAGDAAVIDYRLLHGTHPNRRGFRRDCVLLSFAPSWSDLPTDLRGHLIRHPAQPSREETVTGAAARVLPTFDATPFDLPLNRVPPQRFSIA